VIAISTAHGDRCGRVEPDTEGRKRVLFRTRSTLVVDDSVHFIGTLRTVAPDAAQLLADPESAFGVTTLADNSASGAADAPDSARRAFPSGGLESAPRDRGDYDRSATIKVRHEGAPARPLFRSGESAVWPSAGGVERARGRPLERSDAHSALDRGLGAVRV